MASFTPRDDDFNARITRIRGKILDAIDQTLDELVQPALPRAAIEGAVWAHVAPLLCRQATCRRAKRCRRKPCTVPQVPAARHAS